MLLCGRERCSRRYERGRHILLLGRRIVFSVIRRETCNIPESCTTRTLSEKGPSRRGCRLLYELIRRGPLVRLGEMGDLFL